MFKFVKLFIVYLNNIYCNIIENKILEKMKV